MNHPLNNIGWGEVRARLNRTLSLASEYLEYKLETTKVQESNDAEDVRSGQYYYAETNQLDGFVVLRANPKYGSQGNDENPSKFICSTDELAHAVTITSLLNQRAEESAKLKTTK